MPSTASPTRDLVRAQPPAGSSAWGTWRAVDLSRQASPENIKTFLTLESEAKRIAYGCKFKKLFEIVFLYCINMEFSRRERHALCLNKLRFLPSGQIRRFSRSLEGLAAVDRVATLRAAALCRAARVLEEAAGATVARAEQALAVAAAAVESPQRHLLQARPASDQPSDMPGSEPADAVTAGAPGCDKEEGGRG